MKKILLALALIFLVSAPARSQSFCDTQTTGMLLPVPDFDTPGFQWFTCMRNSFLLSSASSAVLGTDTTGYMLRLLVDSIGALSATEISFTSNVVVASGTFFINGNAGIAFQIGASSFVVTSEGRVGVGTADPLQQLDVRGTILSSGIAAGLLIHRGEDNGFMSFLRTDDDIILGIGLGDINWFGADRGVAMTLAARIAALADGTWTDDTDVPTKLVFSTTPDGTTTLTERMVIDEGGRVGIGTTNPTTKFSVADGSITISQDSAYSFIDDPDTGMYNDGTANEISFKANGAQTATLSPNGIMVLTDNSFASIGFGNLNKLRLNSTQADGHVQFLLDSSNLGFFLSNITYQGNDYDWTANESDPTFRIYSGNNPDNDNTQWMDFAHDGSGAQYDAGKGSHTFSIAGSPKVTFATNGNVGIGETNPDVDLEVGASGAGTIHAANYDAHSSRDLKSHIRPLGQINRIAAYDDLKTWKLSDFKRRVMVSTFTYQVMESTYTLNLSSYSISGGITSWVEDAPEIVVTKNGAKTLVIDEKQPDERGFIAEDTSESIKGNLPLTISWNRIAVQTAMALQAAIQKIEDLEARVSALEAGP